MKPYVWKPGVSQDELDLALSTLNKEDPWSSKGEAVAVVEKAISELQEQKDGAYWERNMVVLLLATLANKHLFETCLAGTPPQLSGWYRHQGEGFEGWSRVISLFGGIITFHVPDDFDLGYLSEIAPNWNGHTTAKKWYRVMQMCDCVITPLESGE